MSWSGHSHMCHLLTGIIDLNNMAPTILVPHPGGTSTPPMERITYIPGTQLTFPPRPYNPASLSPGKSSHGLVTSHAEIIDHLYSALINTMF